MQIFVYCRPAQLVGGWPLMVLGLLAAHLPKDFQQCVKNVEENIFCT